MHDFEQEDPIPQGDLALQITALAVHRPPAPRPTLVAGGAHDGAIHLWDLTGEEVSIMIRLSMVVRSL